MLQHISCQGMFRCSQGISRFERTSFGIRQPLDRLTTSRRRRLALVCLFALVEGSYSPGFVTSSTAAEGLDDFRYETATKR